jgi:hypothetical protein
MTHTAPFKLLAIVLAAVLVLVAGLPARTEALDPLTIVSIASLAAGGLVLIGYLVVANAEGNSPGGSAQTRLMWLACAGEDDCAVIPEETAQALMKNQGPAAASQAQPAEAEGP